jgi:hypothetical protein
VLKNITLFQKMSVDLEVHPLLWEGEPGFDKIWKRMEESKEMEGRFHRSECGAEGQEVVVQKTLLRNYQKFIEYFSERANSYYLIFVHKLNALYQRKVEIGAREE